VCLGREGNLLPTHILGMLLIKYSFVHLRYKIKNIKMKNYLVVNIDDANDFFLVSNLNQLIKEMYECELFEKEFEEVERMFFECFKVFTSESEIIEE
jgi:hypothetical protein